MGKNHRKRINLHHHYSAIKFYTDKIECAIAFETHTHIQTSEKPGQRKSQPIMQLAKVINNEPREGC